MGNACACGPAVGGAPVLARQDTTEAALLLSGFDMDDDSPADEEGGSKPEAKFDEDGSQPEAKVDGGGAQPEAAKVDGGGAQPEAQAKEEGAQPEAQAKEEGAQPEAKDEGGGPQPEAAAPPAAEPAVTEAAKPAPEAAGPAGPSAEEAEDLQEQHNAASRIQRRFRASRAGGPQPEQQQQNAGGERAHPPAAPKPPVEEQGTGPASPRKARVVSAAAAAPPDEADESAAPGPADPQAPDLRPGEAPPAGHDGADWVLVEADAAQLAEEEERARAATRIQAVFRGNQGRKQTQQDGADAGPDGSAAPAPPVRAGHDEEAVEVVQSVLRSMLAASRAQSLDEADPEDMEVCMTALRSLLAVSRAQSLAEGEEADHPEAEAGKDDALPLSAEGAGDDEDMEVCMTALRSLVAIRRAQSLENSPGPEAADDASSPVGSAPPAPEEQLEVAPQLRVVDPPSSRRKAAAGPTAAEAEPVLTLGSPVSHEG